MFPHRLLLFAIAAFFALTACNDETGQISDPCPDGSTDCVTCEDHGDCEGDTFCDGDHGVCVATICTPNSSYCDGSSTVRCDNVGSGFLAPQACETGLCDGGQCICGDESDCHPGEDCVGGACTCASSVTCGQTCCGDGESCQFVEICDDGDCQQAALCQPECHGSVCGLTGTVCCEGETPECGPGGQCAPSCEGQGELCGEDFDQCCPTGDLCIFGQCRTPGASCQDFSQCDWGEYCDTGLGRCMSDDFPEGIVCELDYDFEEFEPQILWHWEGVTVGGFHYVNVAMTPVVADMTGNGIPDVAFNAYPTGSPGRHLPVVIDGASGETIYYNDTRWARNWSQLALVDITGDGHPEIVMQNASGVGVIKNLVDCPQVTADDDCYLWFNEDLGKTILESHSVADITADGKVEIFVNNILIDALTGDVIADAGGRGYDYGLVADVTGDGKMEVLAGNCLLAYDTDAEAFDELWCEPGLPTAGMIFGAIGDVVTEDGRDGEPEFVLTGNGQVYVVAADTGDILHQFAVPGGGNGGPPIIADFDGDGRAEFGIAGSGCYTVFDLDCLGPVDEDLPGCIRPEIEPCTRGVDCFEVEACPAVAATNGTGDGILWSVYIQDISSSRTGSSVFDFLGNGRNEVVYNDECLLMVFDGQTGIPQFQHPNTTRTASEYPIVVDVNGDSRTNIVVAANNDQFNRDCATPIQNRPDRYPECHEANPPAWCTVGTTGVLALQDPEDRWVRTRRIWNQFNYHIENATDAAQAPTSPAMPWQTHNTYRANRQGEIPLNAPDVVVSSVQAHANNCPLHIEFQATIQNLGMSAIPSGLPVSLFDIDRDERLLTTSISQPISPGGTVVLQFSYEVPTGLFNQPLNFLVAANEDGSTAKLSQDCNPESAEYIVEPITCRYAL